MPLYEYLCGQCGERTEVLEKVSAPTTHECPKCAGEMKRLHSAPAIQFKGSGFYKTDYASASSKAPSAATSTSDTKTDTKGETKSETKTETKSETKSESKSDSAVSSKSE